MAEMGLMASLRLWQPDHQFYLHSPTGRAIVKFRTFISI